MERDITSGPSPLQGKQPSHVMMRVDDVMRRVAVGDPDPAITSRLKGQLEST